MDKRIFTACRLLMEVALSQFGATEDTELETESGTIPNPQFQTETFERMRQGETVDVISQQTAQGVQDESVDTVSQSRGEGSFWNPFGQAVHGHTAFSAPASFTSPEMPEPDDSMRALSEYFERDARRYGS